jgi:hypothetical protein
LPLFSEHDQNEFNLLGAKPVRRPFAMMPFTAASRIIQAT